MPTDICTNRRNIGSGRGVLVAIGDLDRDPLKKLVTQSSEPACLDRLDKHVEVLRSDDDCRPTFVQVAPQDAVGLRGLLPRMKAAPCG
ncbi:MAG: hypothetical protein QOF85_2220 [Solirubrobacterales bacterium]|jgi:hypothetical protein|nr:hypothetical protein [Solirubrobacterales bacterium]